MLATVESLQCYAVTLLDAGEERCGRLSDLSPDLPGGAYYRVLPGRAVSDPAVGESRNCYTITSTGIVYGDPVTGEHTRFLAICDNALLRRIVDAIRLKVNDFLEIQRAKKSEIGGLITADERLCDVRVAECEQEIGKETGTENSSDPYCAGIRICKIPELTQGRVALGEFHTHPHRGYPDETDFFPPSGQDIFQLHLAFQSAVHNLSVVIALEGIYLMRALPIQSDHILSDIKTFYRQNNKTEAYANEQIRKCRQPSLSFIKRDGSTPCLAATFDVAQNTYNELIADLRANTRLKSKEDRIINFASVTKQRLGVAVRFTPHCPPLSYNYRGNPDEIDTVGMLRE